LAKLAQDLDCTRCTTWVLPDGGVPAEEYANVSLRRFGQIGRVLEEQGIRLGLEFIGPAHFRTNPDNVWFYDIPGALDVVAKIQEGFTLENIGLLVDSFHWYTSGGTPMDLAAIPIEQIVHVHVNDAPDVAREAQQDQVRLLPGEGIIDLQAFLQTLDAVGYDGPLAVETFSKELNALAPQEAAARAGRSVQESLARAGIKPLRLV
jgi:sugar phosphate isomerase/epimerase